MKKAKQSQDSPALALLRHVWDHALKSGGPSWRRLNSAMHTALRLAIESGMEFAIDDFGTAFKEFRGGYWNGYATDECEQYYAWAVAVGNTSAVKAFEAWADRQPFLVDTSGTFRSHSSPVRATVGTLFKYGTEWVRITSFDTDCLIACTYKESKDEHGYRRNKIARRYRITHKDIYADRAVRKAATTNGTE